MVLSDNGKTSHYTYNAAGERIMKSHGTMEGVYINGAPQGITLTNVDFRLHQDKMSKLFCAWLALKFHETDNFTLYPASIISINKNRFTKHYFLGDKRVASRIGTGLFNNVYGRNGSYVTAGQQDYVERMNQIQKQKEAYYKQQGIAPGVPTMKGAYGDPENTKRGYNSIIDTLGNHDVPQGWIQTPHPNTALGTTPDPPVSWNDPTNPDDPQAGYGYIPNDTTKEETFFYHSDHLGSTSYITDDHANITQYDAYLPYGELLVDEHSSSEDLPYKFNGKQFDEETGLYYYGARYLNSVTSLWYGVDPLAKKYANNSSYTYCLDNPIRWIDRKGMKWEDPKEAEKLKNQINTKIESIKKDISNYQKKLMQEGLSTRKVEKINEQINEAESRIFNLNKSKSDIDLLGQDENNTYVLTRIDGGRHTVRQGNNEKVYIETSSDALSIHEITHVRQSLTSGGLRFGRGGELLNAGKSLAAIANMEIEAYRMQYSFDTTFPGNTYGKGLNGIDLQSVGNIMDDQHQIVYPIIYDYAVSVIKANEKSLKISKSKMR